MRLKDAIASLQLGRKKKPELRALCTIWSEQADDGPLAVPLPEYPRPQMKRADWTCLNGWWEYGICPAGEAGKAAEPDGSILVPFSPETMRSGVERTLQPGETLWYRRTIENLQMPEGKRLILHFGAVDERCTVFWNGHRVGSHRNGYLAFSFDVTEFAVPGRNELKVLVRDDTDEGNECRGKQTLNPGGMFYHAQSGIWQTVWMEMVPEIYLKHMKITPYPEEEAVELALRLTEAANVRQGDAEETVKGVRREIRITVQGDENIYTYPMSSRLKVRIPVKNPRLWSPENPELYDLRIEAGEDVVESYFAMRSFGVGSDEKGKARLLLNGKPYFFNGILDQGYWPESLMTPPSDEALVYDIEQMKKYGFNMLRKHVKIESARFYYHCDRIGMVVWQDMINGGGPVQSFLETYLPTILPAAGRHLRDNHYKLFVREDEKARKRFERDIVRMVHQLYNYPCIGLWVPFNEGWGQFDALRIEQLVRKADPTRPIDHASGWFDQGGGDVRSVHNYFRPLVVEKDERAFVISEYGGINCQIPDHSMSSEVYGYHQTTAEEFPQAFAQAMEQIHALVDDGLCAAVYTQVSDIEEETNGLLTYDRKAGKL